MKSILTLLFSIIYVSSYSQHVIGWLAQMPAASKVYGNLHPRIAMDKYNNPMLVWGDEAGKVYFSKWGGETFSPPIVVSPPGVNAFATSWAGPDIAAHGDTVYIVYKQVPEEDNHVYIMHSFDGGVHFSVPDEVDVKGRYITRYPTVTTDETGNPYVSYMKIDRDYENARYVVARSLDMGETFLPDTLGSVQSGGKVCECSPAALVASGTAGVLLYRNNIHGLRNIWAGFSNNSGKSFHLGIKLDSSAYFPETCPASAPSGVIIGDTMYAVYMSGTATNGLIYLSKLSLSDPSLTTTELTGSIPGIVLQNFPRISGTGLAAGVVWTQTAGGNNQVCMALTDDLRKGFPKKTDTVADGVMLNADIALGGGFIYVVWEDKLTNTVMYRRGLYMKKDVQVENTSIIIASPPKGQKHFFVNLPGILSCTLTDEAGHQYEMDVTYPHGENTCKVDVDEMEPGNYSVKIWDNDGRTYNARVELK